MNRAVPFVAVAMALACRGERKQVSTVEADPSATAAATGDALSDATEHATAPTFAGTPRRITSVCPEPWWHNDPVLRSVVWPDCPIDPPFSTMAAHCLGGRGCMRPCRKELGDGMTVESATTYTYDADGHLTRSEERGATDTVVVTCEYDASGKPTACSGGPFRRDYAYAGSRLVRMKRTWSDTRSIDFETFEYDDRGRLSRVTIREHGEPAQTERYHYDAAGRLVRIESAERPQRFSYDALGRLVKVDGVMPQELTWEPIGRVRAIRDYATVEPGRWLASYDASGRLVEERREGDGRTITYRYDCK